ncbi:MAG: hypothetical protein ABI120_04545 [Gemmatimonadaceae bacterium]
MTKLSKAVQTPLRLRLSARHRAAAVILLIVLASGGGTQEMPAASGNAAGGAYASMVADPDVRTVVMLPAQGRHVVLEEMHGMLMSVEGYVAAVRCPANHSVVWRAL